MEYWSDGTLTACNYCSALTISVRLSNITGALRAEKLDEALLDLLCAPFQLLGIDR